MSTPIYEPLPTQYPDLELWLPSHLRSLAATDRAEKVIFGRRHPDVLPVTIAGVTYDYAVVVRDDGSRGANRLVSVTVRGKPAKDGYGKTRALAEWVASRLRILALAAGAPVADCLAVRGPMSVADDPPEFQITADLLLVG